MLNDMFKIVLMGGKAAAIGTMLATTAVAQTVVETPAGNTAVVVDPALEADKPVGTVAQQAFPLPEQFKNDQAVSEALLAQGFTDIRIERRGPIMTVTAQRNGVPTELVYSTANGTLISIDGVEMRAAPDSTSNGESRTATTDANPEAPTDDAATDDGDTAPDDGADDGADAGMDTDDSADGGSDTGTDNEADTGADPGSDGDTDAGADTGGDGGATGGSDSDTDGSSDGGSDSNS